MIKAGVELERPQSLVSRAVVQFLRQTLQGHGAVGVVELVGEQFHPRAQQRKVTGSEDADEADRFTRARPFASLPVLEANQVGLVG